MTFQIKEQDLELIEFNPAFADLELSNEIEDADMLRATTAMSESWEETADLPIDKMCSDIKALIKVVERKSTYADFVFKTDIHNKSYLQ